ncbi:MAG: hypothetical protein LUC91_05500 [Prevotella sp.]|nr:hypothetical protein [Prevotella sp.]
MENFNIRRFGKTLQLTLIKSRREYLNMNIGFFIAYVLYSCFILLFEDTNDVYIMEIIKWQIVHTYAVFYSIYLCVGGCLIFNNMKTKENRISFIMLPASNLEKYLARYIYVSVFWFLIGIVTFCIANLVSMPLSLAFRNSMLPCLIPDILRYLFEFNKDSIVQMGLPLMWTAVIMGIFWYHTFTVLCGTIYRRNQVVFTWLTTFILIFIFLCISVAADIHITIDNGLYDWEDQRHFINLWSTIMIIVFSVLIVLNYYLSYVIFRRMQVVNNKWINL